MAAAAEGGCHGGGVRQWQNEAEAEVAMLGDGRGGDAVRRTGGAQIRVPRPHGRRIRTPAAGGVCQRRKQRRCRPPRRRWLLASPTAAEVDATATKRGGGRGGGGGAMGRRRRRRERVRVRVRERRKGGGGSGRLGFRGSEEKGGKDFLCKGPSVSTIQGTVLFSRFCLLRIGFRRT